MSIYDGLVRVPDVDREIERAANYLYGIPFGVERAMYSAFNRAAYAGRTAGVRALRMEYTVPYKTVLESMAIKKADRKNLTATVTSKGSNLRLSEFRHKPTTDTTGGRRAQVRVSVRKGSDKPIGQGFIHKGNVKQRVGKTRYPVKPLYGPAVPVMMNNPDVVNAMQNAMIETAVKRLDHETGRILAGHGRKTAGGANRW